MLRYRIINGEVYHVFTSQKNEAHIVLLHGKQMYEFYLYLNYQLLHEKTALSLKISPGLFLQLLKRDLSKVSSLRPGTVSMPQFRKRKYKLFLFAPSFQMKIRLTCDLVWHVWSLQYVNHSCCYSGKYWSFWNGLGCHL